MAESKSPTPAGTQLPAIRARALDKNLDKLFSEAKDLLDLIMDREKARKRDPAWLVDVGMAYSQLTSLKRFYCAETSPYILDEDISDRLQHKFKTQLYYRAKLIISIAHMAELLYNLEFAYQPGGKDALDLLKQLDNFFPDVFITHTDVVSLSEAFGFDSLIVDIRTQLAIEHIRAAPEDVPVAAILAYVFCRSASEAEADPEADPEALLADVSSYQQPLGLEAVFRRDPCKPRYAHLRPEQLSAAHHFAVMQILECRVGNTIPAEALSQLDRAMGTAGFKGKIRRWVEDTAKLYLQIVLEPVSEVESHHRAALDEILGLDAASGTSNARSTQRSTPVQRARSTRPFDTPAVDELAGLDAASGTRNATSTQHLTPVQSAGSSRPFNTPALDELVDLDAASGTSNAKSAQRSPSVVQRAGSTRPFNTPALHELMDLVLDELVELNAATDGIRNVQRSPSVAQRARPTRPFNTPAVDELMGLDAASGTPKARSTQRSPSRPFDTPALDELMDFDTAFDTPNARSAQRSPSVNRASTRPFDTPAVDELMPPPPPPKRRRVGNAAAATASRDGPAPGPSQPRPQQHPPNSEPDIRQMAEHSKAVSALHRAQNPKAPRARVPWSTNDAWRLVGAVGAYDAKWSAIGRAVETGELMLDQPRDHQALRDKARLLKMDMLKTDRPLAPGFDLVFLGKKEREAVMAVGKNPGRVESDVDENGRPTNTAWPADDEE